MLKKTYVTEEGVKNLKNYKYSGSDASLIYKYIISPLAQKFIDHCVPEWLAPNLITTIGFIVGLIPHILVWIVLGDRLAGEYPTWLPITCAVCTFIYSFLDNADGKQARKTGTSSPLGLLFDHGCDSLMPIILGTNIFAISQADNGIISVMGFVLAAVGFLFPTWEEYYLGTLDLPIINGAIEGIIVLCSVFLFSAAVGPSYWTDAFFGIPRVYYLLACLIGIALPSVFLSINKVYQKLEDKIGQALYQLITPTLILSTLVFVTLFSPSDVVTRQARFLVYIAGFSFAKLMTHIQLAHVAGQEINQFLKSIWIPQLLLLGNTISGMILGKSLVNEDYFIYILVAFVIGAYVNFMGGLIVEMKNALGISVFTIKKKTKAQ